MKEAAGEANMTVVTIVLIGIVLGVGTLIVTNIMNNTSLRSECTSNGFVWQNNACYYPEDCQFNGNNTVCSGTPISNS